MKKSKWIIASNRLPLARDPATGKIMPGSGGLVTAISSIKSPHEKIWVGTSPDKLTAAELKPRAGDRFKQYVPVDVSPEDYNQYYNGFSNDVLWPLCHYETSLVKFAWEDWDAYVRVNQAFADAIVKVSSPGDLVWVHDFHLFLLPRLLRQKNRKIKIGFFLHIPFPSSEVYRTLPVRLEILEGILSSDLIGFHDHSYLRHFCSSVQQMLGIESSLLTIRRDQYTIQLGVFPVSIDTHKFTRGRSSADVRNYVKMFRKTTATRRIILGVDRLDYTKGVEFKLRAFRELLKDYPEFRGKVNLYQIAVPTRKGVPEYMQLKENVERMVGEINGEFGSTRDMPVHYLYTSIPFHELVGLYSLADALLVTSKRDGMNLVALEYLATQEPENPGVVLLSEFTGAISTLSNVLPINPWDIFGTSAKLAEALKKPRAKRAELHRPMLEFLEKYTATEWAEQFMRTLESSGNRRVERTTVKIQGTASNLTLPASLRTAVLGRQMLLLLDYDGTLVPIEDDPDKAVLPKKTADALHTLAYNPNLEILIMSGRRSNFLATHFKNIHVSLVAENGAKYFSADRRRWQTFVNTDKNTWFPLAQQIMKDYAARVPHSFIEQKEYSLAWHYRKSPPEFAAYQSRKMMDELLEGLANLPLRVLHYAKIVECRAIEANKKTFIRWFLNQRIPGPNTVVTALGDDDTDEELFTSLPPSCITVKIGDEQTNAKYHLPDQKLVLPFLQRLARAARS